MERLALPAASGGSLIDHYRAIESKADQMLDHARQGQWREVQRARDDFQHLIASLKRTGSPDSLGPKENQERLRILKHIVLCDGQTRRLAAPHAGWIDQLLQPRPARL